MIVRALDSNHDWTFGKGRNNYLKDRAAFKQECETRILSWLGDCFFDLQAGIDWRNRLGSKNPQVLLLEVSTVLMNTEGFQAMVSLTSNLNDNRVFTMNYTIQSVYGIVSGTINQPAVTGSGG